MDWPAWSRGIAFQNKPEKDCVTIRQVRQMLHHAVPYITVTYLRFLNPARSSSKATPCPVGGQHGIARRTGGDHDSVNNDGIAARINHRRRGG